MPDKRSLTRETEPLFEQVLAGLLHTSRGGALSPDGRWLATGRNDDTVRFWDAATGRDSRTLRGKLPGIMSGRVGGVAFSPDGKRLASAGKDGTVRIWDAAGGQELLILKGHTGAVRGVTFSPDSKRLASAGEDATVRVW
jgi:WD40 repeat protein